MNDFPLVLVPALGADDRLWGPVIERVSEFVDPIVIRGDGTTIEEVADDVLAQAPDRFVLAGISLGGYVALDIALRQTGRLNGLVLVNTSARDAPPERQHASHQLIELIDSGGFEQAVERISSAVAPRDRPEIAKLTAEMSRGLGLEVLRDQQLVALSRKDRRNELSSIEEPTLVVVGSADAITPLAFSEELAEGIPNAELVTLDGVGHFSPLEDPARVSSNLLRWILETQD